MGEENKREVVYYKQYYLNFFRQLTEEVQKKFNWTLQLVSSLERIPTKYFEHITGSNGLYEIRVEVGTNIYRVFCFFDKEKLVIIINGFQKKSQKTPRREIALAQKIKKIYFDEKE